MSYETVCRGGKSRTSLGSEMQRRFGFLQAAHDLGVGRGPEIMPVQVPGAAGLEPWRRSGRYPCRGDRQGRGEDRSGDGSADGGLSRLRGDFR
jgi:hypothetical protein